ncbi:iron transporter [Fulvitalea axinellae]|uniref:Iron transporter n=1 Tax=Fulvitalea axinellae TaxID=1182444 RepID=A0AAU9CKA6_9BACT|nr:iron transporter [Fulvitalea axinellae]
MKNRTVADLKIGETAIIRGFADDSLSLKLLEMGCLPGEEVTLKLVAPLGDPIAIRVADYQLSLRKDEASVITVE